MLDGILALVVAALFAGAAVYINLAEHPARLHLPIEPLLTQWKPSYARGFATQASLAVVGAVFAVLAWWHFEILYGSSAARCCSPTGPTPCSSSCRSIIA
jgi:hypothetical protein